MVYMEMGARARPRHRSNNRPRPGQLLINCYNLLQLKLASQNHYAIMVLLTKETHMIIFYTAIFFSVLIIINFYN
jgi:hypothetical protein